MLIDISFSCICGYKIDETFPCPEPNLLAEKNKDSYETHEDGMYCTKCGKEFLVSITNSFGGADVCVNNGQIDVRFSTPYFEQEDEWLWERDTPTYLKTFNESLESVDEMLCLAAQAKNKFHIHVMIYGHIVAAVEGFLASVFISTTINNEDLIRRLIESDPQFSNMKFSMSQIFEKREQIKDTTARYLKDLIFHDLKKVKPMYLSVLEHDFGDIEWLFEAVQKRHHCVHRAGYDKEGVRISIDENEINLFLGRIENLVKEVISTVEVLELRNLKDFDLF